MIGLSMTAIGQRPLPECLAIYEELKGELSLDYLELAVALGIPGLLAALAVVLALYFALVRSRLG